MTVLRLGEVAHLSRKARAMIKIAKYISALFLGKINLHF